MVSHFANSAVQRRRTMKLCGHIGRTEILVLVDYDSVGTFVSTRLVDQLLLDTRSIEPTRFVAANGSPMIFPYGFLTYNGLSRTIHLSLMLESYRSNALIWCSVRIGLRNAVQCGWTGSRKSCVSLCEIRELPCLDYRIHGHLVHQYLPVSYTG